MSSPPDAVPIPTAEQMPRRKSGVVQSSLDLVFSYSRSQQMRYGQTAGSAPSFINSSDRSHSSNSYGSARRRRIRADGTEDADEEEGEILEEDEDEDEGQDVPRRRSSDVPGIIGHSDEDLNGGRFDYDEMEASVSTITPLKAANSRRLVPATGSGSSSVLGTSSSSRASAQASRLFSPVQFGTKSSRLEGTVRNDQRDLSPTGVEPADPNSLVLQHGDGVADKGRRRSSMATRRPSNVDGARPIDDSTNRRGSVWSRRKSIVVMEWGASTDGQTLFNGVAVLVGIGLLSLPLAFAYAGWIAGTAMLVGFAALTCHTAKLLARLIRADPSLRGYTDIGKKAFGTWASGAINVLFCLELFALGVALIVLFGDSLNVIYPDISADTFKIVGFVIVLPTALLPLSLLSLPSLLSTLSSLLLVIIILIDGLSKPTAPGSLRDPSPTHFSPEWTGMNWLGGIGLVLAGFGGHAVMPSLARDMKHPERFDKVINRAFVIATIISFVAGAAGYLMIGHTVSDEITRDLMQPKYGYPRWLNLFALWMIVINPVTKFGLCSRPLNLTLETVLGITEGKPVPAPKPEINVFEEDDDRLSPSRPSETSPLLNPATTRDGTLTKTSPIASLDVASASEAEREANFQSVERRKFLGRVLSRTLVTGLCTVAAIFLPGFGRVMAFLGSFSAFLICIILPLTFYLSLAPRLGIDSDLTPSARRRGQIIHWALVLVSAGLMVAGTTWAFIPGSGHGELEN